MVTLDRRQLVLLLLRRRVKRRKRITKYKKKYWILQISAERKVKGEFHCLVQEIKHFDHGLFFKHFQMLPCKLEELLGWVVLKITKSGVKRDPVGPEKRLCITLQYLVTGDVQITITASYRISQASIGCIIKETTGVLWDTLMEKGFIMVPEMENQWKKIPRGFQEK